jgi:hypothetical protein
MNDGSRQIVSTCLCATTMRLVMQFEWVAQKMTLMSPLNPMEMEKTVCDGVQEDHLEKIKLEVRVEESLPTWVAVAGAAYALTLFLYKMLLW